MIDVTDSNAVYYYHFDGLGSVRALSNVSGEVVESYSYDVFGQPTIFDADSNEISDTNYTNPYMFTARRLDTETDNYYYRARFYNPEIGRFLQTAPIGYPAGLNLYQYCDNNPVNWNDPYGLESVGFYFGDDVHFEKTAKYYDDYSYPIENSESALATMHQKLQTLTDQGVSIDTVDIYGHDADVYQAITDKSVEDYASKIGNMLTDDGRIELETCFLGNQQQWPISQDIVNEYNRTIRAYEGLVILNANWLYMPFPIIEYGPDSYFGVKNPAFVFLKSDSVTTNTDIKKNKKK